MREQQRHEKRQEQRALSNDKEWQGIGEMGVKTTVARANEPIRDLPAYSTCYRLVANTATTTINIINTEPPRAIRFNLAARSAGMTQEPHVILASS